MKNYFNLNIFIIIILFFSFSKLSYGYTDSNSVDINLQVGACNYNSICESSLGEDLLSCAADCTPIVVPPTSDRGASGSLVMDNSFNNLTVEVSYNSATIKWTSFIPTISNLKWGTNPDYKDGVIKNINYLLNHEVVISNLLDGTIYYFTIESENLLRKTIILDNQVFRTLSLPDTTPPGNPTNLNIDSTPQGVTLSWGNPKDEDFDYIRVMRNTDRYYGSPFSGVLVYEGKGIYFLDSKVEEGKKYFYSLFSRDRAGNYSSGSLVDIIHNPGGFNNFGEVIEPKEEVDLTPFVSFIINQGSSNYDFKNGSFVSLKGDIPIIIKTDYTSNIKNDDMWVTIKNIDGKIIWQYMFSRERDEDGYLKTSIPFLSEDGYLNVYIYKYKNDIKTLISQGSFYISKIGIPDEKNYVKYINIIMDYFKDYKNYLLGFPQLLFILLIILFILKRINKSIK